MDPVSIVLTVLPFLGGAVKAYSSVRKKCKAVSHFSRDLGRLRGQLSRQQQIFINDSHLLVRVAVDDETTIQQMLGNPQDTNWSSPELDLSLKDLLADSYEAYLKLVQEVSDTNEELEIELSEYERLSSARQKGESFKDTEKRLRNRVSIAWTKADFEKTIGSLRDLNTDLCRLRQQVFELQKPHNANLISFPSRRANAILTPGYDGLKAIRTASEGLHNALAHSWSRNAISTPAIEARHDVKLFADVKVGDGVRMNLAILCHDHHFTLRRLIEEPAWVVLQVRSKSLDKPETDISTPPDSDDDRSKKRRVRFANESSTTRNTLDQAKPRALPTRGRFAGEAAECEHTGYLHTQCLGLQNPRSTASSICPSHCLGYVDSLLNESWRHSFYQRQMRRLGLVSPISEQAMNALFTMGNVLSEPIEGRHSVLQQLILARYVAETVLKFHSTQWLGDYVTTNDISFLGSSSDFTQHLDTIHLDAGFVQSHTPQSPDSAMADLEFARSFEEAKIQHGVRNVTLWCLGTMLLQIGCWRKIDAPDDVIMIRKKASLVYSPGPRYQQLTKKCLECDFGYGDDLSQPRLHQAVYKGLVCELDDMIQSLDINA